MPRKAMVIPLRSRPAAFELKVTLRAVQPPIWRRLRVATSLTLRELHHVLQIAFGWNDSHLHEFAIGERRFGMPDPLEDIGEPPLDERDFQLGRLVGTGDRFDYVYDFGDDWRHEILVGASAAAGAVKAECLAGERTSYLSISTSRRSTTA
jgi:hypothetical protein